MRNSSRGLEKLSLAIALDLEPHDPPEGMADRIFSRIEAESVPSPAAKVKKKSRGIWLKSAAIASAAALFVLFGTALYYQQQKTADTLEHSRAEHVEPMPNKGTHPTKDNKTVARDTKHDQTKKGADPARETQDQIKKGTDDDRVINHDQSSREPKANIRREEPARDQEKATVPQENRTNKKPATGSEIGDKPSNNNSGSSNGGNRDSQGIQSSPDTQQTPPTQTPPTQTPQAPPPTQRTNDVQMADERQPMIQANIAIGGQQLQAGISIGKTPIEVGIAGDSIQAEIGKRIIQVELTKRIIQAKIGENSINIGIGR